MIMMGKLGLGCFFFFLFLCFYLFIFSFYLIFPCFFNTVFLCLVLCSFPLMGGRSVGGGWFAMVWLMVFDVLVCCLLLAITDERLSPPSQFLTKYHRVLKHIHTHIFLQTFQHRRPHRFTLFSFSASFASCLWLLGVSVGWGVVCSVLRVGYSAFGFAAIVTLCFVLLFLPFCLYGCWT